MSGEVDDDLFPDRATVRVLQKMHFVEHHDGEVIQIEEMVRLLSFYDLDDNALMFFQMLESND